MNSEFIQITHELLVNGCCSVGRRSDRQTYILQKALFTKEFGSAALNSISRKYLLANILHREKLNKKKDYGPYVFYSGYLSYFFFMARFRGITSYKLGLKEPNTNFS